MSDSISDLLDGALGFAWPAPLMPLHDEELASWLHKDKEWTVIETLVPNPWATLANSEYLDFPEFIYVLTSKGGALLLEVREVNSSLVMGQKASTRTYHARSVIRGVPIDRFKGDLLTSISIRLPNIGRWAGMCASTSEVESDGQGHAKKFSISVSSEEEYSASLTAGRALTIGTSWHVTGTEDRQTIYAPVTLKCASNRPKRIWNLLSPLLAAQDLISLAFEGFVVADTGYAAPVLVKSATEKRPENCEFWNGALMAAPSGVVEPRSMTEFPLFNLSDLGGISGVARWIRLSLEHSRATRPVVSRFRHGDALAEVVLMDSAAGIEYWVAFHRRSTKWAKNTRKPGSAKLGGNNFAAALARKMGAHFNRWCGDVEEWSSDFHETYNALKHNVNYNVDDQRLIDLAASGRLLLAATLVDRAANSNRPSRAIFENHRLQSLGARLAERYGNSSL